MKNLRLQAFLFTIILIFSGCYEDNLMFIPDEIEEPEVVITGDIERFFNDVTDDPESIKFKAENGRLIITENETIIEIYANSFVDGSGNQVDGEVEFRYLELLDPSEYAFYNLPTVSDKKLLRTEGVFKFEAYQDGEELKLKDGKRIVVRLPDDNPESGMEIFTGEGEGENFNWTRTDNGTIDQTIRISEWEFLADSANQQFISAFGYEFDCNLFQWINVDIFVDVPESEKAAIRLELPEKYSNKNTAVYLFFNERNSILAMYSDAETMQWYEPYGLVPLDYRVTIIVISNQGEDLYHFGLKEFKVEKDEVIFIEPEEKSLDEIAEIIKKLE